MRMRILSLAAAALVCAGCASITRVTDYQNVGIESGEIPIETVEIENSGWLLLKFIPLGSGDPLRPNEKTCRFFSKTMTLQNNLEMLEDEMERVEAKRVANLVSHRTDESVFIFLLTRRAYHTSAVLLK